jgi:hypothetical protein
MIRAPLPTLELIAAMVSSVFIDMTNYQIAHGLFFPFLSASFRT